MDAELNFRTLRSRALQNARRAFMRSYNLVFREKPGKVVFASFNGGAYSDNPRALSEALHAARPDLDLVWLFENPEAKRGVAPDYVRRVRFASLRALCELATASAWVDNTTKPAFVYKSPRQFYLQTWHGDRGFKTVLLDSPNYQKDRRLVERECDLMLSGSRHFERVASGSFGYRGRLLKCGSPRNDLLFENDPARAAAVRAALGLQDGVRVLLYAPTFRREAANSHGAQAVEMDIPAALDALERGPGGRWVCLARGHSKVRGLTGLAEDPRVVDATGWEDMAELLLIADALVTDYSSSVGDFALTGRPIVLFQPDHGSFSGERTFYFDVDQTPFWIARDQAALEARLEAVTPESAERNDREILAFFGAYETGSATKSAVDAILRVLDGRSD